MNYGILFERVQDEHFPAGYFYAHIPSLGLTTPGLGIEGTREAAQGLILQWLAEKRQHQETVASPGESFYSTLEISFNALQGV